MRPIDADALKIHVCDMCDDGQRECKGDESCAILCWINDMPTIEAEPVRHGRWIEGISRGSYSIYCSYCGSHKETICPDDYCPSCGALMDLRTPTEVQLDEADSVIMGGADNG